MASDQSQTLGRSAQHNNRYDNAALRRLRRFTHKNSVSYQDKPSTV